MRRLNKDDIRVWTEISSYIATIVTFVIFAYTVWVLYLLPGDIKILMPGEVGFNLYKSPSFEISATFSNEGSPNTLEIIKSISATGWIHRQGKQDEPINFSWRYVERFVSIQDYEHNYKMSNETISNDTRFIYLFESYRAPFSVPGGKQPLSKILYFESSSKGFNFSENFSFEVEIEATTMDGGIYKSPKISYFGNSLDIKHMRTVAHVWIPNDCYQETSNSTFCRLYT